MCQETRYAAVHLAGCSDASRRPGAISTAWCGRQYRKPRSSHSSHFRRTKPVLGKDPIKLRLGPVGGSATCSFGLFVSDLARRVAGPAMERTPEIRGVAEPQRESDILVRQIRAAKVFQRKLSPQFIAQPAEGNALLPELASQRSGVDVQELGSGTKGRRICDIAHQDGADLAGCENRTVQPTSSAVRPKSSDSG